MNLLAIWITTRPRRSPTFLVEINRKSKNILVVVTHSAELAGRFPKVFELVEGRLEAKSNPRSQEPGLLLADESSP